MTTCEYTSYDRPSRATAEAARRQLRSPVPISRRAAVAARRVDRPPRGRIEQTRPPSRGVLSRRSLPARRAGLVIRRPYHRQRVRGVELRRRRAPRPPARRCPSAGVTDALTRLARSGDQTVAVRSPRWRRAAGPRSAFPRPLPPPTCIVRERDGMRPRPIHTPGIQRPAPYFVPLRAPKRQVLAPMRLALKQYLMRSARASPTKSP